MKQYARASPFEVNIYSAMVDLSPLREMLSYQPLVINDAKTAKDLPLKWEQAHSVVGTQLLCLHFEPVSDTLVNLVITGNTWIFREDLEKNGFGGARADNDSNSYYRFLKDVDVTAEASRNTILRPAGTLLGEQTRS